MTVILTCCNSPLENDSALIINILELFKQAVFINANKNCNENDDYREFDTHISCKKKRKVSTKFCEVWFLNDSKATFKTWKISWNSRLMLLSISPESSLILVRNSTRCNWDNKFFWLEAGQGDVLMLMSNIHDIGGIPGFGGMWMQG